VDRSRHHTFADSAVVAMSFTPQLFADEGKLLPLANDDEFFILERAKISFQVKTIEYA
jgi:hypothetical protein